MKKDSVQTNVSLPAPAAVKPPNYMVFSCSLDRADKAARAAKDPARLQRFKDLRTAAHLAYKAKDYAKAVGFHDAAHAAAKGEDAAAPAPAPATPEVVAVAAAGSPRPPKASKGKKAPAPKAAAKPAAVKAAAAKPAAKQPTKAAKPAKGAPRLSAMGAAHQVLAASKEPLGVKAIVAEMSAKGLWTSPGGKTPAATLAAALQRDIAAKGRESRFKKADRGLFAASGRGA